MKKYVLTGAALLALAGAAWAQGPVSGRVGSFLPLNAEVTSLPGATIYLDGQAVGQTDDTGGFILPAVSPGSHKLRITSIGHTPLETKITGQIAPQTLDFTLEGESVVTGEALVTASRASDRTATAYSNLSREDLDKRNFAQDLPYLLDQTPSVVVTSDAGAGVGYTDIRIRGTSNTGINMTINGVPLNDPESRGHFW
ncbi:TonB-dependent receptor plug domain-containing protein [Hymenobacter qilianensis]|uniref:TonB-dependent receptor plug domain-containing protein n=1 Tax=Hymenobacter qilianensis TaxID=1385715 RepID=A0A7H0GQY2_9BACT|nr:TonB-dependent receptor plug domain-containing protein [Hymenobacter qilianensis]QNP50698.1 TonB-dependent receptor plug domain-containing protein [Hymenobacter qilianensis]